MWPKIPIFGLAELERALGYGPKGMDAAERRRAGHRNVRPHEGLEMWPKIPIFGLAKLERALGYGLKG